MSETSMGGVSRRALSLLLLAAGAAVGLLTPPQDIADYSTYVGMTDSLVHDGDFRYAPEDLARMQELQFGQLPAGLLLTKRDRAYFYGKPALYSLAATPWFAVFGLRGFTVLNGVLLAALVLLGADILAHRLRWGVGLAVAAVSVAASATHVYRFWIDPHLLLSCLVAGAIAAHRRGRPALTAALLALAAGNRFPYLALAAAPVLLYALERRWRSLVTFAAAGVAVGLALLLGTRMTIGQWSPYTGERYYYADVVPYDAPSAADESGARRAYHGVVPYSPSGSEGLGMPYSRGGLLARWRPPSVAEIARHVQEYFFGRFAGVAVYYPAFFACLFWIRRLDREKAAWLLAFGLCVLTVVLVTPHNMAGGVHAVGNRLFVLLPVAWIMVDIAGFHPLRLAASSVLLALAVPLWHAPLYYSRHPGQQAVDVPYRWFPVEWTQAVEIHFPFEFPGLWALTENQYEWEGAGVWTRGASTAEFVLVRPAGEPVQVELSSLLPAARIGDGDAIVEMRFEPYVAQQIPLTHPRAVVHDEYKDFAALAVYHLTIETGAAVRPIERGINTDRRSLGVFVRPLP